MLWVGALEVKFVYHGSEKDRITERNRVRERRGFRLVADLGPEHRFLIFEDSLEYMEGVVSAHGKKHNVSSRARKSSAGGKHKDIFLAVRQGSMADVDLALVQMKESGGNIDSCNLFGLTPLHIATWRNHIPIVKRLLVAGADPNTRDGESGWSSLHRALHFGHLAVASILLQFGASVTLEDSKSRTPIDLISGPVSQILGSEKRSVATEVYSWGSGVNYQLGTGNAHMQKLPCKVDCLHASFIKLVSAAKFHSVAVTARGELYAWGFGRGGRLGHPESEIHSGQAAVITPQRVISGLGARHVRAIAAAKHHTVVATESGEVFTWGSNREGQLGHTGVDTQPTPRRVSILRSKIVAVAAANKHTAVVSDSGEVFTWGCNKEGQLGYSTSNSGSNCNPRAVEYLKGKVVSKVAAAKHHTVVLGADGEIYTWGHGLVNPKRVVIARNMSKHGGTLMNFHKVGRLHVVSVAAGMVHSLALTEDGALFYWVSSDPDLKCQQLHALRASNLVSVSAGKYWSAAVTSAGDVYMWDGKKAKDKPPIVTRLHGVKRSTSVSVGETHLLAVSSVYHPAHPLNAVMDPQRSILKVEDELDEGFMFGDMEADKLNHKDDSPGVVPTLKSLCERAAVQFLLEPRNALQLLEIADSLQASDLKRQCEEIVIRNLDYIFTVSSHAISNAPVDVLAHIEELLAARSSEPWSYRRLPTPTAPFPAIIDSEGEVGSDLLGSQRIGVMSDVLHEGGSQGLSIEHGGKGEDLSRKQRRKKKTKPRPEELPDSHTSEFGSSPMKGSSDFELQIQDVVQIAEAAEPKASTVNHITGESPLGSPDGSSLDFKKLNPCRGSKKKNRKGGLSMFLSGALDDPPKVAAPQPPPRKVEGPAWGGAKRAGISASLREIQDEQKKTVVHVIGGSNDKKERVAEDRTSGKIPLSSFLSSKPIPVAATHTVQSRDVDRNAPCWSASGTPPQLSQPSLRDIQMQEEKKHSLAHSPKTRTAGFAVSTGMASPSDSGSQNRWFRPEVDSPSSIRLIQIEEKAMKDLRRIYGSVRLVKNQS